MSCEDKSHIYFNSESLGDLNLANIDGFWDAGKDIDTSYYMGSLFESVTGDRFQFDASANR